MWRINYVCILMYFIVWCSGAGDRSVMELYRFCHCCGVSFMYIAANSIVGY